MNFKCQKKMFFLRILHENVVYRSLIAKGGYLRPYFETIEDLKRQQTNDSGAQVRLFKNEGSQKQRSHKRLFLPYFDFSYFYRYLS